MAVRKHLLINGLVQGVFYRDTCRQVASEAGVSGWASNLPDGRVEVVLEGEPDAVDRVVSWCGRGTRYSSVESVDVTDEAPQGESGFRIR